MGDFFRRLPVEEYLPTWHGLRTDLDLALARWPDVDPETGAEMDENAAIRARQAAAAQKAALHAGTPTLAFSDTLGRPILSVAHNRFERENRRTRLIETIEERYATRTDLDIEGQPLRIVDALQFHERHGEVCPANWKEGEDAMKPTAEGVADYLSKHK